MGKEQDDLWNTDITIELIPDSRFTKQQMIVIANDFGMTNNVLSIHTNAALIRYVLDSYNIDIHVLDSNPQGQQIVVKNMDELRKYLA